MSLSRVSSSCDISILESEKAWLTWQEDRREGAWAEQGIGFLGTYRFTRIHTKAKARSLQKMFGYVAFSCLPRGSIVFSPESMKHDSLEQFARLRKTLLRERTILQRRLAQINTLVGPNSNADYAAVPANALLRPGRQRGRRRNPLSLRQAILQVTAAKPLTKEEILEAVKKVGYRFSTPRPMATINSYLYQKGAFVRRNGRFAPGKTNQ